MKAETVVKMGALLPPRIRNGKMKLLKKISFSQNLKPFGLHSSDSINFFFDFPVIVRLND